MHMVYRNADEALRRRRDELLAARRVEVAELPAGVRAVYSRRQARRVAGGIGILGAVVMATCAALRVAGLTTILQTTWLAMAAVYLAARLAASLRVRRLLDESFLATDDPAADVERFEHLTAKQVVLEAAARIERRSVALPMVALALLLPLTLHYLVAATVRATMPRPHDFDAWISMSLLFVGHCHLVLAYQAWSFAQSLRAAREPQLVGLLADRAGWHAWGVTIAWSVVAGFVLLAVIPIAGIALLIIAPVLVGATGLTFIPAMFNRMGRKVRRERTVLQS
jgi:hypothetical protein